MPRYARQRETDVYYYFAARARNRGFHDVFLFFGARKLTLTSTRLRCSNFIDYWNTRELLIGTSGLVVPVAADELEFEWNARKSDEF